MIDLDLPAPDSAIPLAWSDTGEPVAAPEDACAWRVRRQAKGPGKPAAVYGRNGLPLHIPLDSTPEDLARAVRREPGRYRLDWLDADHQQIAGAAACFAYVWEDDKVDEPTDSRDVLLQQQMRIIRELAETIQTTQASLHAQLGGVMSAAAQVVQAADGAGIAQRPPLPPWSPGAGGAGSTPAAAAELVDDVDTMPPWAEALIAFAGETMPDLIQQWLARKAEGAPSPAPPLTLSAPAAVPPAADSGAERNAAPSAAPSASEPVSAPPPAEIEHPRAKEILACLGDDEQDRARQVLAAIPAVKRAQLLSHLAAMPLPTAVRTVRAQLGAGR